MRILKMLATTALLLSPLAQAQDEPPVVVKIPTLSAIIAADLARAAYDECTAQGHRVAVAVVARDGRLVAFIRNPDAGPHTTEVARRKAWSANSFRNSTSSLAGNDNASALSQIPGAILLGGGLPINLGGYHYGGVGVSGAPGGDLDDACAVVGIEAVSDTVEMAE